MKKSLIIICIILCAVILSGCSTYLKHYEDDLYSEKVFEGYDEGSIKQNNSVFTREKAIEKAIDIFDKAFNVKIDRSIMSETVRLYRRSSEDTFKWSISWYDREIKLNYDCEIDSNDGRVLRINKSKIVEAEKNKDGDEISYDEAVDIITPFLLELNMDINDYYLKPYKNDYLTDSSRKLYSSFLFYNNANDNDGFVIIVDSADKKVISYEINKFNGGLDGKDFSS